MLAPEQYTFSRRIPTFGSGESTGDTFQIVLEQQTFVSDCDVKHIHQYNHLYFRTILYYNASMPPTNKSREGPSRKRKRNQRMLIPGVPNLEYPKISGIPVDVVPGFIETVRLGTKFFARYHHPCWDVSGEQQSSSQTSANGHAPQVLDALMNRMEAATSTRTTAEEVLEQRRQAFAEATERWLATTKRFVRKPSPTTQSNEPQDPTLPSQSTDQENANSSTRISVPYASFLYLWDLQQTHTRVAVRRAALYLTGLLWQRSKDCRWHLDQDQHLDEWMKNAIFMKGSEATAAASDSNDQTVAYLQVEAHHWLTYLIDQGYGRVYPKIGVAAQRLRQQCPHISTTSMEGLGRAITINSTASSSTMSTTQRPPKHSSMVVWRQLRDIALQHGKKEAKRIQNWIDQAYDALDILVPRLGLELVSTTKQPTPNEEQQNNRGATAKESGATDDGVEEEDDEEEDDIDWEDGGMGDEQFDDGTNLVQPNFEHLSAVERTLAAMESAGGLRGGGLEIDLRPNSQKEEEEAEDLAPKKGEKEAREAALATLEKCVMALGKTHRPRLDGWLEGLQHADHLKSPVKGQGSLVSLPTDVVRRRRRLFQTLSELQESIGRVVEAASKLGMESKNNNDSEANETSIHDEPTLRSLCLSSSRPKTGEGREVLLANLQKRQRKPKGRTARSGLIQIKFRTS